MLNYLRETDIIAIREDIPLLAPSAGKREHEQSSIGERNSVCYGERLQMESVAGGVRELAYSLCAHESLEQERGNQTLV